MNRTHENAGGCKGSLAIAGAGIRLAQLTLEAQQAVSGADIVFAVVASAPFMAMLEDYNPHVVSLSDCYAVGRERIDTYHEMAERVLNEVRSGKKVCFVIYGHPTVFAYPTRIAAAAARAEGFDVQMLPGISAEDSLFCDLELDPSVHGSQIYGATQLVQQNRSFDPYAILTIWQASIIGETRLMDQGDTEYHDRLCDRLEGVYGLSHPVILYEGAIARCFDPYMRKIAMSELRLTKIRPCCTLVIPPMDCPDLVKIPLHSEEPAWITLPS